MGGNAVKTKHGQSYLKILTSKKALLVIFLVIMSNFFISCNSKQSSNNQPQLTLPVRPQYTTQKVTKGTILLMHKERGRIVTPIRQNLLVEVSDGYLKKTYALDGDKVKKGDLLAEIECPELENNLRLQEINVKLAQVEYEKLKSTNESEYNLKKALLNVELENQKLEAIKEKVSKTKLFSDLDGVVIYKNNISIGEVLKPGTTLFTIADTKNIYVQISGYGSMNLEMGMNVKIDYMGKELKGKVVSKYTEKRNQNEENPIALISIETPVKDLKIGDNVSIDAEIIKKENVIKIPSKAIRSLNGYYVRVVENGEVKNRDVQIGISNESEIEIENGLKEGEEIIID